MVPPGGLKYEQEEDELDLPFDLLMLVSDQKCDSTWDSRILCSKDIAKKQSIPKVGADTKVILREPMGRCAVIGDSLHALEDSLMGPLSKPRVEVQAKMAFQSLFETHHLDTHAETMRSLEEIVGARRAFELASYHGVSPDC